MKKLVILFALFTCLSHAQKSNYKLVVFEGSDWCVNCLKLDKKVLKNDEFTAFVHQKNIIVTKVDFPQKTKLSKEQKKRNKELAKKYQFKGAFPTLILVNSTTQNYVELKAHRKRLLIQEINQQLKTL
ncbi:thioredoxin fold domain-containing protein [Wenyingzhuangia sp. IMCC45533]